MQKMYVFGIFVMFLSSAFAQSAGDTGSAYKWKESVLGDSDLVVSENLSPIMEYDLSDLIKTDVIEPPLGFIGNNYERFDIFFTQVKRNTEKPNEYFVVGKNKVKGNISDFSGTITFTDASFYKNNGSRKFPDSLKVGVLAGTYHIEEDKNQKHAGALQGYAAIRFYITPEHKIFNDDLDITADNYSNNLFVGTWRSIDGKTIHPCNWGNGRIPVCGDLDDGKKDFMPAEKYKANGWDKYPSVLKPIWWK